MYIKNIAGSKKKKKPAQEIDTNIHFPLDRFHPLD